jgi:hypothetical protein
MQLILRRGLIWGALCNVGYFLNENGFGVLAETRRPDVHIVSQNVAVFAMQGRRPHMEDRYDMLRSSDGGRHYFAVYDGHGGEVGAFLCGMLVSTLLV